MKIPEASFFTTNLFTANFPDTEKNVLDLRRTREHTEVLLRLLQKKSKPKSKELLLYSRDCVSDLSSSVVKLLSSQIAKSSFLFLLKYN